MIKLLTAFPIFLLTSISAQLLSKNKSATLSISMRWILGFIGLLALDFFAEAVVFEWLQWNGTTKNDWFFMLWWVLVLSWFVYGATKIFNSLK